MHCSCPLDDVLRDLMSFTLHPPFVPQCDWNARQESEALSKVIRGIERNKGLIENGVNEVHKYVPLDGNGNVRIFLSFFVSL